MDRIVAGWIIEYSAGDPSVSDQKLKNLLTLIPFSDNDKLCLRLKKHLILRRIESEVAKGTVSEAVLDYLVQIEKLCRKEGKSEVSEALKAAFASVALYCYSEDGRDKCEDAEKRIWRGRGCYRYAIHNSLRKEAMEGPLHMVRFFVAEAKNEMGPSFLERAAQKVLSDDVLMKMLGVEKDGEGNVILNGLYSLAGTQTVQNYKPFDDNLTSSEFDSNDGMELTVNGTQKSFDGVCTRQHDSLNSLLRVVPVKSGSKLNGLVRLPFSGICNVNSVEELFQSSDLCAVSSSTTNDGDKESKLQLSQKNSDASADIANLELASFKEECVVDAISIGTSHHNDPRGMEPTEKEIPSSKPKSLLPLHDLDKDHGPHSPRSPTWETSSHLPLDKALFGGDRVKAPDPSVSMGASKTKNAVVHCYEAYALKALSTYQQKFGRSSSLMDNRLPSPTPSEESKDAGGDTGGEVSSSLNIANTHPVIESTFIQPSVFRVSRAYCPLPSLSNQSIVEPLDETQGSRKERSFEQPIRSDGPALKRQRSELTNSRVLRNMPDVPHTGGWLDDRGHVGLPVTIGNKVVESMGIDRRGLESVRTSALSNNAVTDGMSNGSGHIPVTNVNTTASLQSLLKDIAVNPTMPMNIIKTGQQKAGDSKKHANQSPNRNSIMETDSMITATLPNPRVVEHKSNAAHQIPQTALVDDLGKFQLRPRDPRRALQSNLQKGGNMGLEKPYSNVSIVADKKDNLKQKDQLDGIVVSSSPFMLADITLRVTKNLKNKADISSISQATLSPPVPQIPSSEPAKVDPSFMNISGTYSGSGSLDNGTIKTSKEVCVVPPQPQNTWGDVEQQKVAIQKERARRMEQQKKMLAHGKLCLVLDLDHTLLNSAKFTDIEPVHEEILKVKEEHDREKPHRHLFRFPHMGMWTKLRPGIWHFLEKASKLYELHLCTMGNKLYATEMAKVLDPKGVIFKGRVISRGDDIDPVDVVERAHKSKDLEGVLGLESAVVIIDDTIGVWPHNKLNLIVVERYLYFPCSRRQFGLPGSSLLEIDHDERSDNGTLASSLAVIKRIHRNFFLQRPLHDADVRNILASEQRKVLGGCCILFSRVFPRREGKPQLHPLWRTAEQFGAVCTSQIDEQVTHVVANSLGTDKVKWALSTGRFAVRPGWVEASALLYRRANEQKFAFKP